MTDQEGKSQSPKNIKLGSEKLKIFFVAHLNRIYHAKAHLVNRLPQLKGEVYYDDLQMAIQETVEDVEKQIARMEVIYELLDEQISKGSINGLTGLIDDAFGAAKDLNLDYIAVPLLAKFYVLPNTLSITAGPQFSFLVNDADEILDTKKFDVAASGGLELKIIAGLFAQARYNIGLTKVSDSEFAGDAKNAVFQLSVGYFF